MNNYELNDDHNDKQTPCDEITIIDLTLEHLEITMNNYLDDVHQIWETEMIPFINSPDCLVFKYLGERDFDKFLNFMLTQDTFKLIIIAQERLKKRKNYIMNYYLRPNTDKGSQTRSENRCK